LFFLLLVLYNLHSLSRGWSGNITGAGWSK
jgi:hypothetical protein